MLRPTSLAILLIALLATTVGLIGITDHQTSPWVLSAPLIAGTYAILNLKDPLSRPDLSDVEPCPTTSVRRSRQVTSNAKETPMDNHAVAQQLRSLADVIEKLPKGDWYGPEFNVQSDVRADLLDIKEVLNGEERSESDWVHFETYPEASEGDPNPGLNNLICTFSVASQSEKK